METGDNLTMLKTSETQELLEARDAELRKVLKLKCILNSVQSLNMGPEQTPEIKRVLKLISVSDYIRLGDEQEFLLDLQEVGKCPPLSYTDSKAVREALIANLRATLTPIIELGDRIRRELPEALTKGEVALTSKQKEIIRLQKEKRERLEILVHKYSQKIELMLKAAEMKMGPLLSTELKVKQAQAQLLQTKAELLRKYLTNEIFARTDHSLKAYKEVDKYLDELLSSTNS